MHIKILLFFAFIIYSQTGCMIKEEETPIVKYVINYDAMEDGSAIHQSTTTPESSWLLGKIIKGVKYFRIGATGVTITSAGVAVVSATSTFGGGDHLEETIATSLVSATIAVPSGVVSALLYRLENNLEEIYKSRYLE